MVPSAEVKLLVNNVEGMLLLKVTLNYHITFSQGITNFQNGSNILGLFFIYFFKFRVWNIFVLPYILSMQQLYPYIDVLQLAV